MPTSGDRKQEKSDFLANGELFFLTYFLIGDPDTPLIDIAGGWLWSRIGLTGCCAPIPYPTPEVHNFYPKVL